MSETNPIHPLSRLGNGSKKRRSASLLAVALGLTVTVLASPPVAVSPLTKTTASKTAKPKWFQVGKASWYGGKFDGRKTASGEKFDMNALTCAHRELPLGSWVRVTNLHNNKQVYLRVNDRGPIAESLIVDLSYAAARTLGISGLGKVKVETVNIHDAQTQTEMAQTVVAPLPIVAQPQWTMARGIGR